MLAVRLEKCKKALFLLRQGSGGQIEKPVAQLYGNASILGSQEQLNVLHFLGNYKHNDMTPYRFKNSILRYVSVAYQICRVSLFDFRASSFVNRCSIDFSRMIEGRCARTSKVLILPGAT